MTRWMIVWAVAIAGGIMLYQPLRMFWPWGLGIGASLFAYQWRQRRAKKMVIALALFWLCLAAGRAAQVDLRELPFLDAVGDRATLRGVVLSEPEKTLNGRGEERLQFRLASESVNDKKETAVVFCYLSAREPLALRVGQQIEARGQLAGAAQYHNPGQPWSAQMRWRCRIESAGDIVVLGDDSGWRSRAAVWRQHVRKLMMSAMPPAEAELLEGLLFGGAGSIPAEWLTVFSTTGLIHILSVSGTHVALLTGLVFWLGRLLLPVGWAAALAVGVSLAYGSVCGFSSPVVRSLLMGWIALGGLSSGRDGDAAASLSLAGGGLLLYDPCLLWDISFQLSFAATAGLLAFSQPLQQSLCRGLPDCLAGLLAVTIGAQLGALPLLAWYFKNISVAALPANVLVAPLLDAALIAGLAAAVSATVWLAGAKLFFVAASFLLSAALDGATLLAHLPGAQLSLPPFGMAGGILYWLLLSIAIWPADWKRGRRAAAFLLSAAMVVVFLFPPATQLEVHVIDVGQGDAILIKTPHGHAVLIDAGAGEEAGNVGKRAVLPYLLHQGIRQLDFLLLSHGHDDHAGGAAVVLNGAAVEQVLLPDDRLPPAVEWALRGRKNVRLQPGQQWKLDGVLFSVLAAEHGKAGNEASVVVRLQYGRHSFLLTGDLEGRAELELVAAQGDKLASTVLKTGHHGARRASTDQLLAVVRPQFAVISAGAGNSYGHPHPETLHRLQAVGANVYRTDRQGAVVFRTDGETLTVRTWREQTVNPWEWRNHPAG